MASQFNPTILVTGGAGFIGSCFVRQCLDETSWQVVVLDRLTYAGHRENLAEVESHERLQFVVGDIGDGPFVGRLLDQTQPHWVVNFAAESHVDRSIDQPADFVQTNVVGTCQLLEASLRYWQQRQADDPAAPFGWLQVSTDEVFGELGLTGRFDSTCPYLPNSPYAASKAAADHFVRAYYRTYGLPTMISHSSNNYGPYQFPEKLMPLMIRRAAQGLVLPVYGDGSQVRDWLHVEDHCRGLRRVLERGEPGRHYLFGGGAERTNLQVVHDICDYLDRHHPLPAGGDRATLIQFVQDRPGHDQRYAIDLSEVEQQLGWSPQIDYDSGLAATVEWYLAHTRWADRVLASNYDGGRLGLGD